ncbi:MAG: type 1 glutamine amidotransferase, partial [Actinomycetales bacterium]
MTRILVVEHDAECPPALFGTWLEEAGCELDVVRPHAGDELPALDGYDGLVVLGGPMGADDDEKHAWIGPVKQQLRDADAAGLPTLGICLGHQLIAAALGGTVRRNDRGQQVGLLGVGWTGAAAAISWW